MEALESLVGVEGERIVVFRKAELSDLPTICAIERASHPHPWSIQALEPEFTHPWSRFRLAILRDPLHQYPDEIMGYCLSWLMPAELHILNLAVLPAYRRKGVARRALLDTLQIARQAGVEEILLEVRASNQAAIALYQGFGFYQIGLRKKYYDKPVEDAWVLILELKKSRV
jgi:ribosomal-protein-alanine N-acetyltransferase